MKNKILVFLDIVAGKNQLQVEAMHELGFEPVFFVSKYNKQADHFILQGTQVILEKNFFKRLLQVRSWIKRSPTSIHHIEVYPGGRFSFIYFLFAKIYRIKTICVERGDLLYFNSNGYSRPVRFSMRLCYKLADIVWYREPYMKALLERLNKNLFFIHNAVKVPLNSIGKTAKDITFLWLNRIIPQRRSDWFIEILDQPAFSDTTNYLVGIDPSSMFKREQQYIYDHKPANLIVEPYSSEPSQYYKRAKFFVLPADVVFANNALLEAMSYGVIPLITDQPGSNMIVENGVDGFISHHDKNSFEKIMLTAIELNDEMIQQMSEAAASKSRSVFSEVKYKKAIKSLYSRLEAGNT